MEDLFGINAHRQGVANNIQKALGAGYEPEGTDENKNIQKGRVGVYENNAKNRRLNRVGQQYGKKKEDDEPSSKKSSSEKQDMSSHAAKASDGALKRAAADKNAPEDVRNAAKEELKKRDGGNEDKGDKKETYNNGKYRVEEEDTSYDGRKRYNVYNKEGKVSYSSTDKSDVDKFLKKEKEKEEKEEKRKKERKTHEYWDVSKIKIDKIPAKTYNRFVSKLEVECNSVNERKNVGFLTELSDEELKKMSAMAQHFSGSFNLNKRTRENCNDWEDLIRDEIRMRQHGKEVGEHDWE